MCDCTIIGHVGLHFWPNIRTANEMELVQNEDYNSTYDNKIKWCCNRVSNIFSRLNYYGKHNVTDSLNIVSIRRETVERPAKPKCMKA